jgi:hypothetical protein
MCIEVTNESAIELPREFVSLHGDNKLGGRSPAGTGDINMARRANVSFYIPHVRAFQDISQAMRVGFLRRRIYGQTIRNIASDIIVH